MRITKLEDVNLYRVEQFQYPRFPFSLWKAPEWRVVWMWNLWSESNVAEFSSREAAERYLADCIAMNCERAARDRKAWVPL